MDAYLHSIRNYYGDRVAKRSRVPLMYHIVEGLAVLEKLHADLNTKRAFVVHPIFQEDQVLGDKAYSRFPWFDPEVVVFAMEYRSVANEYLSDKPPTYDIRLSPLPEVNLMLTADKIQNKKDFVKYHLGTHPRSDRLEQYFNQWLAVLGISDKQYNDMVDYLVARFPQHQKIDSTVDPQDF